MVVALVVVVVVVVVVAVVVVVVQVAVVVVVSGEPPDDELFQPTLTLKNNMIIKQDNNLNILSFMSIKRSLCLTKFMESLHSGLLW